MRSYPEDKEDRADLDELNAPLWMENMLKKNASYPYWGNHEDYMYSNKERWESPIEIAMGEEELIEQDEYNEIVNFYFEISRANIDCPHCHTGYNPETEKLLDTWYSFDKPHLRWCDKLDQSEVDMLYANGRLSKNLYGNNLTAEEVNRDSNHDMINQHMCVRHRARNLGVYGLCDTCEGKSFVYTAPTATLSLQMWLIHPRKGASRGYRVTDIKKEDVPTIMLYLQEAKERSVARFGKLWVNHE